MKKGDLFRSLVTIKGYTIRVPRGSLGLVIEVKEWGEPHKPSYIVMFGTERATVFEGEYELV